MKAYELLLHSKSIIESLIKNKVNPSYIYDLDLFNDYLRLKSEGHKKTYIISYLSEVYRKDESTIYRIVNKLGSDLKQ